MILISPIIKKEIEVRSRRMAFPLGIAALSLSLLAFSGALSLGALASMREAHELRYFLLVRIYACTALFAYVLLLFIAPLLTVQTISGEREAGTLDLLLTTRLTPRDIVTEKFISAFMSMAVLLFSSLPALLVPLIYGGVSVFYVIALLLSFLPGIFLVLAIGLFMSSLHYSTLRSLAFSYLVTLLLTLGILLLVLLLPAADALLILDPLSPVMHFIFAQTGCFGEAAGFTPVTMILEIAAGTLLLVLSARRLMPS